MTDKSKIDTTIMKVIDNFLEHECNYPQEDCLVCEKFNEKLDYGER